MSDVVTRRLSKAGFWQQPALAQPRAAACKLAEASRSAGRQRRLVVHSTAVAISVAVKACCEISAAKIEASDQLALADQQMVSLGNTSGGNEQQLPVRLRGPAAHQLHCGKELG